MVTLLDFPVPRLPSCLCVFPDRFELLISSRLTGDFLGDLLSVGGLSLASVFGPIGGFEFSFRSTQPWETSCVR